ncbi:MAG: hypothetical protein HQK79_20700 [Desulfobacterales bacterium]|nr:hypothetical protein [Desulfobacterales bacterium]
MNNNQVKIFTASLGDPKKYKASAVYNGEQLIITQVALIGGTFISWKEPLVSEIIEKKEKGFACLIEDMTTYISQYATQYMLEDVSEGHGGRYRNNYQDAFDWYFALHNMGNLLFHKDCTAFEIKHGEAQKVEKTQDDKGRSIYKVDWSTFNGGHRAVLLCVVAAMIEPVSERYLEAMYGKEKIKEEEYDPWRTWKKITKDRDATERKVWQQHDGF